MTASEFADQIGDYSVLLLWAALIIRARPALKGHYQRGLWLAILTVAVATTLFQPVVINWSISTSGDARGVTLCRNIIGVLAAGLTLLFIVDSTRGRRLRLVIAIGLACAVITLLGMDLAQGDYQGPVIPADGGPAAPSPVYWVIVCAAHLITDVVTVLVCTQYSRRTNERDLVWSLRLFAIGSVLAIAYWAAMLVHLYFRMPAALPYLAVVINIHGASRALTLLVPAATGAIQLTRDARTVWVLWPMWRDLFTAVPNVALVQPQATRLHEVLRPRAPLALQAHRLTIETYDAILHLQSHVPAQAYEQALQHAQHLQIPAPRAPAAALAGALGQARRAKLAGETATEPHPLPGLDRDGAALLLTIAHFWPSMSTALPGSEPADITP